MAFNYLFLGHLLGDFTLQTNKIALNKATSRKWNIIHSLFVTICILIFSIPFGKLVIALVVVNGVLHYFIDSLKSRMPIKSPAWALVYFVGDQAAHISIIYIISNFAVQKSFPSLFNEKIIWYSTVFIFVLSVSCIINQFILRSLFSIKSTQFFMENEKNIGNITRIFSFIIFILSYYFNKFFLLGIFLIIAINIFFYRNKWYKWMSLNYMKAKLFLDLIMSLVGLYLLTLK